MELTGRHPDDEMLSDLAADLLPPDQAQTVQDHVIACSLCADLLADAERVRRVLRGGQVEPMPAELWDRLDAVLAAEADGRALGRTATSPSTAGLSTPELSTPGLSTSTPGAFARAASLEPLDSLDAPTEQWARFVEEGEPAAAGDEWDPGAPDDEGAALDEPADGGRAAHPGGLRLPRSLPRTPSLSGVRSVRSLRSRRDIRSDSRASTLVRVGRPLAIAASVLAAATLGGWGLLKIGDAGSSSSGTVTAASEAAAPAAAASGFGADSAARAAGNILTTGTNYTDKDIVAKALALPNVRGGLTSAASGAAAAGGAPPAGGAAAAATSAAAAAPSPAASASAAAAASASPIVPGAQPLAASRSAALSAVASPGKASTPSGNLSLLNPAALQACLTALGAGDEQPLAVDLAKYEGRDAAIVVLAARDGGYEVWAVARDCNATNGGQLVYKAVPPS